MLGRLKHAIGTPKETTRLRQELAEARERLEQQRLGIKKRESQIRDLRSRLEKAEVSSGEERAVVESFHKLYYGAQKAGGTWHDTYWMGTPAWKCPLDMWVYQEILFEARPDFVVETGTAHGGSAYFLAHMFDLLGKGQVVTVDIEERPNRPRHERITYLSGSSTSDEMLAEVERLVDGKDALVILDSDHSRGHVLAELKAYSNFVKEGGYLVVEDTNVNGHPVLPDFGPGPMEAVEDFLKADGDFTVDASKEKFYMTFNPKGFLKRGRRS
jgi:cephalosporin hydroxylase